MSSRIATDNTEKTFKVKGIEFYYRREVVIPAWATEIILVANQIDGYPPYGDQNFTPKKFLEKAVELQTKHGAGEWEVRVFAVSDPKRAGYLQPYGKDNAIRSIRGRRGGRVRQIATFDYMRWDFYKFTSAKG